MYKPKKGVSGEIANLRPDSIVLTMEALNKKVQV